MCVRAFGTYFDAAELFEYTCLAYSTVSFEFATRALAYLERQQADPRSLRKKLDFYHSLDIETQILFIEKEKEEEKGNEKGNGNGKENFQDLSVWSVWP